LEFFALNAVCVILPLRVTSSAHFVLLDFITLKILINDGKL
jgi:hypothetical protein